MTNCLLIKSLPKHSIHFILQLLQNLWRSYHRVLTSLDRTLCKVFIATMFFFLPNSYSFSIVSENKVLKYLNSLGINKATGLDDIPSRFVRYGASIIACPLTHVINLSLIQDVVLGDLKSARVVPLFGKSDKTEVDNYRPVSILTIISKVFERVAYVQVDSYLDQKTLLYKF